MTFSFKKKFGQNFLKSNKYVSILLDSARINSNDSVLEIGTGYGIITSYLAPRVHQIISFEIDKTLIPILKKRFKNIKNVKILNENFLDFNMNRLNFKSYKVVSSLPYNTSKKIIKKLLESTNRPEKLSLIVQKEVAENYCSTPPNARFLANYVRLFGKCRYITKVSRKEFMPEPKVDGAIIVIDINKVDTFSKNDKNFFKLMRSGYIHPRKKLLTNISKYSELKKETLKTIFKTIGISTNARAQELTFEQWKQLSELVFSKSYESIK